MATITSRTQLRDYSLRKLGSPVVRINVAPEQLEDCLDDAILKFQTEHMDGSEVVYLPITITAQNLIDQFFDVDPDILSITQLIHISDLGINLFSDSFQYIQSFYPFALSGQGLLTFDMALQYRNVIKKTMFGTGLRLRHQYHGRRLFVDVDWTTFKEGQIIVVEAFRKVNPEFDTSMYNDPWLRRFVVETIRLQWGQNMSKYGSVQIMGGVSVDGASMVQLAKDNINELMDELETKWTMPTDFFTG
jgi:hypothetical protein